MSKQGKILIVEDDIQLAHSLAERLSDEKYQVITAADGESAIDMARNENPDLIVLDVMIPKLDGLSVCRILSADPTTANILIIMLTARAGEMDRIIGLQSGADDYMVKPFALGELLARIRAVLRRNGQSQIGTIDELSLHDIRINITARKAFKLNQEIKLSIKEFDLIVYLMRNKGSVISRDLILAKVWGYDYFIDKRTVDVHIRWLREKIEADPSEPLIIQTIRGIGYRFQD